MATGFGPGEELLSAEELARYLGVEPVTVYRQCRDGCLPGPTPGDA